LEHGVTLASALLLLIDSASDSGGAAKHSPTPDASMAHTALIIPISSAHGCPKLSSFFSFLISAVVVHHSLSMIFLV